MITEGLYPVQISNIIELSNKCSQISLLAIEVTKISAITIKKYQTLLYITRLLSSFLIMIHHNADLESRQEWAIAVTIVTQLAQFLMKIVALWMKAIVLVGIGPILWVGLVWSMGLKISLRQKANLKIWVILTKTNN